MNEGARARFLREAIEADRYPLSPRVRRLKELLAKIDPAPASGPSRASVTEAGSAWPLPIQRNNGIVRSTNGPGKFMLWEIELLSDPINAYHLAARLFDGAGR
jgi:hypothetical protein